MYIFFISYLTIIIQAIIYYEYSIYLVDISRNGIKNKYIVKLDKFLFIYDTLWQNSEVH